MLSPSGSLAGFRVHQDKLDGYLFFVPENWLPVTVSTCCAWHQHV